MKTTEPQSRLLNAMEDSTNKTYTENAALTNESSKSALVDLFGLGGAFRSRSDEDKIDLFMKAFAEDRLTALKLLFYLRDVRADKAKESFSGCV